MKLDKEEKEILKAYQNNTLKSHKPTKKELQQVKKIASSTLRKDRRITIRLYDHDFKGIQRRAAELGMPYQTLISSMIHRYVEGDLVEKR